MDNIPFKTIKTAKNRIKTASKQHQNSKNQTKTLIIP